MANLLIHTLLETARFDYHQGDVTVMGHPYTSGWASLPSIVTAQIAGGEARITRSDGSSQTIADGKALYVGMGVHHCFDKITVPTASSRWSHVSLTVLGSLNLFSLLEVPSVFGGDAAQKIGDINEEMAALSDNAEMTLSHAMRRQSLGFLLGQTLVDVSLPHPRADAFLSHVHRLAPVMSFISENLHRSLSRDELAEIVNLSPSRFYVIFKDAIGMSVSDYLQQIRMQKAQRLLISTDLAISEVAAQSGYEDYFHFSRMFKKRYGTTPSRYRRDALRTLYTG